MLNWLPETVSRALPHLHRGLDQGRARGAVLHAFEV
jgi:hypothetical protein